MWTVIRKGSEVQICDDRGNVAANIGSPDDYRVNARLNTANLMAAAPEMLEVLIDIQEVFRREYFVDDHPILESIAKRCAKVINKTMKPHGEYRESRLYTRNDNTRRHGNASGYTREDHQCGRFESVTKDMGDGGSKVFYESLANDGEEENRR